VLGLKKSHEKRREHACYEGSEHGRDHDAILLNARQSNAQTLAKMTGTTMPVAIASDMPGIIADP
jgi:hypothetical protein